MMDGRILVTGGAGFIGSNFVRYVLDEYPQVEVTTIDALTYAGDRRNLDGVIDLPRHEFVEGNTRDRDIVNELVAASDIVVNFAAESHVDRSINETSLFVETNVQGTRTLLDASLDTDLDQFVQVSTDEVYGEIETGRFDESNRLLPRNPYAATKAAADLLCHSYTETYGLPVVTTRSSNNFGPRQHREKMIPKFITRAVRGKTLPLYGDGSNIREWMYVDDNCQGIATVVEHGNIGEVYNIGSGDERTNLDVARAIVDEVGASENLIDFVEDRPAHDSRYALDSSKVRSLGWSPRWTFEEALKQTVEFYR